ncbi:MAG: T9SS type A sorting domain-containing protein [Owenweeksia sp.]
MKQPFIPMFFCLAAVLTAWTSHAQNCTYDPDNPVVINANTTWNGTQQINSNVEIRNGATLTLYGTVEMLTQGRVIIKPGCKLIINGGHITKNAACVQSWKGIEVTGNSSQSQSAAKQGEVRILNNGKLSYACNAVTNTSHSSGGYNWQTTGGRIIAEDAVFENNSRDIVLLTYHSGSGSAENDYEATFTNCDFLRNNSYTGSAPRAHIALLDVAGVSFKGCEFINTRSYDAAEDRTAFAATNAVFYISASPQRNGRFESYDRAVFASGGGRADKEMEVSHTDFYNNDMGVHLIACSNVKIAHNTFGLSKGFWWNNNTNSREPWHYGVFLDNTFDFSVAANYFSNISSGTITGQTPIAVNEGDGHTNRVYKNTMDQTSGGLLLYNHNRNASATDGLLVQCNDLDLIPYRDVGVNVSKTNNPSQGITAELGIAKHQGPFNTNQNDYSKMANNLFNLTDTIHWRTALDCNESFYYYSNQEPRCLPVSVGDFSARPLAYRDQSVAFDFSTLCPEPPLAIEPADEPTTLAGLQGEDQDWGDEWALLVQLIDNGSTPQLEAQILAAGQADFQDLYIDLMDMSPYVSVDNLLNLLSLSGFPELAIRNVLVANPHGARDPEVMDAVYNHQPPFAASTIADIEAGSHTVTSYDVQTGKIAAHNYQRHELADLLMASYGRGENAISRIAALLENRDELLYHYQLVEMELQAGLLSEAQNHLNAIASTAFMEGSNPDKHQAMLGYYDVVTQCLEEGRALTQLNSEEINELQGMAAYSGTEFGLVRNKAISLLWLNEVEADYHLPELPQTPQGKKSAVSNRPARPRAEVQAYPNPATEYLIVQWDWLQLGLNSALEIELYDLKGALVLSRSLEDFARNTAVLRLHDQKPASYILRLKSADKVLYSEMIKIEDQ